MKKPSRREQRIATLNQYSGVGRDVSFKHKNPKRKGRWDVGEIEDEVSIIVNDYKHVLQRILLRRSWDNSKYAYRTGYWTWTADGRRVVWGQYHQVLSEGDFCDLLRRARAKGWRL